MELTRNGGGPDKSGRPAVRKAQWLGLVCYCVFGLALASLLIVAGCGKNDDDKSAVKDDGQPLRWACIHDAATRGDLADVKRHLQRGADVNATDIAFHTPLHYAAREGHTEIVKLLINSGADMNVVVRRTSFTRHGFTPLHYAAYEGHLDVVKLLVEAGADVNARDYSNFTPLHRAAAAPKGWEKKQIIEFLELHGARWTERR